MSEEITYIATNTDIQVIDTFDPGEVKALSYLCQIDTEAETGFVQFKVVHDGVTAGITQQGLSVSDNSPLSFDANIYSHSGEIKVTPVSQPTTIVMEKTTILANNYAEHTKCGRWIKHTEGFALNSDTVVVRQANNNVYDEPSVYLTSNTLGPVEDGPNLLSNPTFSDTSGWIPHNDAVLSNTILTTSNIYKDNFIYQAFEAELGYTYRASVSGSNGSMVVGTTLSDNNYVDTELAINVDREFTPNTVTGMYYSLGHTNSGDTSLLESYLYKIVPFNTYRYDLGTFFIKWANTAVNTVLWEMLTVEGYPREVKINSNGDVQITENTTILVIGAQSGGNNKLAFSYEDGIVASLNGNSVVSNLNIEILDNMMTLEFVAPFLQFSYVPTVISNTELVVLSNG
jgi:hypothetical protein